MKSRNLFKTKLCGKKKELELRIPRKKWIVRYNLRKVRTWKLKNLIIITLFFIMWQIKKMKCKM